MAYGPFHRLESPTQTKSDAAKQVASGEIWGRAARGSGILSVKAYRNALPTGQRGIEFTTPIGPHPGGGTPFEARWYYPNTQGVRKCSKGTEDFAVITASVRNMQP